MSTRGTRPARGELDDAVLGLLARHGSQILATARRYAATPEDAEDACQRGLEILLTKAPSTSEEELIPWLKTVVKHEAFALRRQPFAAPLVLAKLRVTVKEDTKPERRARAAEALGEMVDPGSLPVLSDAALEDKDASVRAAGARALARLNTPGAAAVL